MSISKIISASLEKDAVALKESLSEVLSEKIVLALEEKISELQEVSKEKLLRYIDKASDQLDKDWEETRKGKPGLSQNKVVNRFQGLYTAQKRRDIGYNSKAIDEEVDQLDELVKEELSENFQKETSLSLINHIHKTYGGENKINDRHMTLGTTGHSTALKLSAKKKLHDDLVNSGWKHSERTDESGKHHTYSHPTNKNVNIYHSDFTKGHINSHLSNRVRTVSHDPSKASDMRPIYD